ncbi:MAG: RNA polymerase sigma factor [Muribaculaceae bacterium]|nr:RNA polymerase sigma factor [Muribaculaceae bacterium]
MEEKLNKPDKVFERIIEAHKASIYSVCYIYAANKIEADDIFQEILINLWKGLKSFRGESELKSWVYRISLNTCISYQRKKRVKTEPLDIAPEIYATDSPAGRQTEQLRRRITRLDPMDRAIVLLWLEDMAYEEIGAIVGMTAKNVGVRLIRIKEKLKKQRNDED